MWRPGSFSDLLSYLEDARKEYYLDGPNSVDWIFRNSILDTREGAFYVDYVQTHEGHVWVAPQDEASLSFGAPVGRLIRALNNAGVQQRP
jgi:hypothetical protein